MSSSARLFSAVSGLVGTALLILFLSRIPGRSVSDLFVLLGFAILFETCLLTLPSGQQFSLSGSFSMVALLLLGGPAAVVVEAVTGLFAARQVRPWSRWVVVSLFNVGQYALSALAMVLVFSRLHGAPGALDLRSFGAFAAGAAAYLAINVLMVSAVQWMASQRSPLQSLRALLEDGAAGFGVSVIFTVPLAYSYHAGGWPLLLAPAFFLMAFRSAIQLYLSLKRTHFDTLHEFGSVAVPSAAVPLSHSSTVGTTARQLAEALRLPSAEVDMVHAAGVLHDIGELRVEEGVVTALYRRSILTAADLKAYEAHAGFGAQIVSRIAGMEKAAAAIRHHHERWDGSGYPDGLEGTAIPLAARIVGAAEAWAMLAVEHPALPLDQRRARFGSLGGSRVDPTLAALVATGQVGQEELEHTTNATVREALEAVTDRLRESIARSQVLESLGIGHILRYQEGQFFDETSQPVTPPLAEQVLPVVEQVIAVGRSLREQLIHASDGRVYDLFASPAGEGQAMVAMFDVTHVLTLEREQRQRIQKAYADVLAAVTTGKLLLLDEAGKEQLLAEGRRLEEMDLTDVAQATSCRLRVAAAVSALGLHDRRASFHAQLVVAEAVGNLFKHAGRGRMELYQVEGYLRVIVTDQGEGIPLDMLPRAILVDGFSTKVSLGKGFNLMLHYTDRLWLFTSPAGTTVALDISVTPATAQAGRGNGPSVGQESVSAAQPVPGSGHLMQRR